MTVTRVYGDGRNTDLVEGRPREGLCHPCAELGHDGCVGDRNIDPVEVLGRLQEDAPELELIRVGGFLCSCPCWKLERRGWPWPSSDGGPAAREA